MVIKNLKDLSKRLDRISNNCKEINGTHSYAFSEIFNEAFMKENTKFSTMDELLKNGGWIIENQKDFADIPERDLDEHLSKTTNFMSWQEMKSKAAKELLNKRIFA
jgi:hypothetical protein